MAAPDCNPQSTISALVIFVSLLFLSHKVNPLSFNFSSFQPKNNAITFEGDAFATNGYLQLTKTINGVPQPNSAGRASYAEPFQLWDAKRGRSAGFLTTFSFVVAPSSPGGLLGDGISFFIAPFNSSIPANSSGGFLGLFSADSALNASLNQIVAVEFDTFGNPWDPSSSHIGIDINTIFSAKTAPWPTGFVVNGLTAIATIGYDPFVKNLSVTVKYPQSTVNGTCSSVSYDLDLKNVLPQWVRIGFSGATGQLVELHKVLSWSFESSI